MPHIPSSVMKNGTFRKAGRNTNRKRIFSDKVVDSTLSPLLYNIECGLEEMSTTFNGKANSKFKTRSQPATVDRGRQARKMLQQSNISIDTDGKDFSLLKAQSNKPGLHSKNIMDSKQFQHTNNQAVTAQNQFPSNTDPFYDLDENENSNAMYEAEQDITGQLMHLPDLSTVASGITMVNLSKDFKGKSKYFTKVKPRATGGY